MYGSNVCHAHGGRAPQTKAAAQRRLMHARMETAVSRTLTRRQARTDGLGPWAKEISFERLAGPLTPDISARRLRQIATEMTKVAHELRAEAKALDARIKHPETTGSFPPVT